MSEDNNKTTSQSNKKRRHKKRRIIFPYIFNPIVYVLISLVFVVPTCIGLLNFAVDNVHKAQQIFTKDYYDAAIEPEKFVPSDKESGKVSLGDIKPFYQYGIISCEEAGLKSAVYYGLNRISLRNGAASSSESKLPGQGGEIDVYGHSSAAFKSLKYVDEGDIITFQTNYGLFKYKVCKSGVSDKPFEQNGTSEILILACSEDNKAFSNFSSKKFYVCAELISGPKVEEVSQK